jgi:hypothetical protein
MQPLVLRAQAHGPQVAVLQFGLGGLQVVVDLAPDLNLGINVVTEARCSLCRDLCILLRTIPAVV